MIVKQQQKPMIRNYFLNNKKGDFPSLPYGISPFSTSF